MYIVLKEGDRRAISVPAANLKDHEIAVSTDSGAVAVVNQTTDDKGFRAELEARSYGHASVTVAISKNGVGGGIVAIHGAQVFVRRADDPDVTPGELQLTELPKPKAAPAPAK